MTTSTINTMSTPSHHSTIPNTTPQDTTTSRTTMTASTINTMSTPSHHSTIPNTTPQGETVNTPDDPKIVTKSVVPTDMSAGLSKGTWTGILVMIFLLFLAIIMGMARYTWEKEHQHTDIQA
ncbi:G8 domain-containing protein DDB_G0286311-like isoform X2 [Carcharodon carcharias]|nr:G8 domain-containing protein DDB_G0286311-like isoform X2 [Carcharodon carcharias]XP_041037132.1 G8 domain-containing protein DDB_G0286311-like isoform X2 [Carcharodon carcharias]